MVSEAQSRYLHRRYVKLKTAGVCTYCGKPNPTGKVQCESCRKKVNDKRTALRAERFAQGLCPFCGKNPTRGKPKACWDCTWKNSVSYQKQKEKKKNV